MSRVTYKTSPDQLADIETPLVGAAPVRFDTPGRMTRDLGESI